ncbi:hypothetical protein AB3X82_29390 [Paraburkholderia phenoliruptrix]|uniref:Uncharacterized protein n=1 Tax=Paraburkholderia phenoliruptrix TaxID=252970 RepID=A0ABV3WLM4_9BURK
MSQRNIKSEIQDAATVAKRTVKYVKEQLDTVASGKSLKARIRITPESRFPMWATTLARILCANPALASATNQTLATLIENENGETGFNASIMSKKLSVAQRHYAGEVLQNYGYATDTLKTGTDIKTIIKNNIRIETPKNDGIVFHADGLNIRGRFYQYKQRENTPTGNPWRDFSVRMYGQDINLQAILFLQGIGIGEFINRDAVACAKATLEEMARRQKLNREPKQSRKLSNIIRTDNLNRNGARAVADYDVKRMQKGHTQWTSTGLVVTSRDWNSQPSSGCTAH